MMETKNMNRSYVPDREPLSVDHSNSTSPHSSHIYTQPVEVVKEAPEPEPEQKPAEEPAQSGKCGKLETSTSKNQKHTHNLENPKK